MRYVFDTEVVLRFYLGERGAERVRELLERIEEGKAEGYMSLVNLTEFYYILHRKSPEIAEEKLNNLMAFGIKQVDIKESWKIAARIKAEKGIPLGDAFAAAAAISLNATLLAGEDSDFSGLDIKIERI